MAVSGCEMEASMTIKWPKVVMGMNERERKRGFTIMRKKNEAFTF